MEKILKDATSSKLPKRSNSHESKKIAISQFAEIKHIHKCKCQLDHSNSTLISGDPNIIECVCHKQNILTRPYRFEESCFIFDMVQSLFGVDSATLLSLGDLVSEVIFPFTPNYDFYRLNFNHRFNIYPAAIVRARTIEDISQTIKFSRKTGIPIRARGGAHAYEPASLVNFGIILDQKPRSCISKINTKNKTVKIQAGALLGPVINEMSKKNILVPFGTCVTNGLAGLSLGGGIGFSLREYGLTLDALVDMKVVLANGDITHANCDRNSDLFWALKGAGGGNFGVVTDFTFKYHTADWVTIFTFNYKFEDTKKVFQTWQKFAPFTNTKLTTEMDIFNRFQPIIVTGQLLPGKSISSDQKKLIKLLQPLIDLNLHTEFSIKTVDLQDAAKYFGEGSYARPLFFYNQSFFNFNFLSDAAIDTIIFYMGLLNEKQSFHKTEIDALGGNFAKIPFNATAFPSRKAIHWFQFTSLWDTQNEGPENIKWLNAYYNAMKPFFPENRKYVNALDYTVPRLSALKSYFDGNLPELIKVKNKYDPTNFFNFEQSIPTSEHILE